MFILSQDREKIVTDFKGIALFISDRDSKAIKGIKPKVEILSSYNCLGKYNTEERAKEILLEIMKKEEVGNRVYYMPEE